MHLRTAFLLVLATALYAAQDENMSYIDNGTIRLGANLDLGGAITYLSKSGGPNLVNSFDWGRQIQMSHYSGPVPYTPNGKVPPKEWTHIGWNPIQAGDCYRNRSKILTHTNDGKTLYVKCIPMHWPLNNEPGECTYECWFTLDGATVQARCRMLNARPDTTQYEGRMQELPAIYTNGPWYKLITYTGDAPFTDAPTTQIGKPTHGPWSHWQATENWAALVDNSNFGLGIWETGVYGFSGGFAGKPGAGGPKDNPTGYIAPLYNEIIDHNIDYSFAYTLIVGSLDEIRGYAKSHAARPTPPAYRFEKDRQHWHYVHAKDIGWPIQGELSITYGEKPAMLIGPGGFWKAQDAPKLYIEAAFSGKASRARLFWMRHDDPRHTEAMHVNIEMTADNAYHVYEVDLSASPEYRGAITGLRLDPPPGAPGDSFRLRYIGYEKPNAERGARANRDAQR